MCHWLICVDHLKPPNLYSFQLSPSLLYTVESYTYQRSSRWICMDTMLCRRTLSDLFISRRLILYHLNKLWLQFVLLFNKLYLRGPVRYLPAYLFLCGSIIVHQNLLFFTRVTYVVLKRWLAQLTKRLWQYAVEGTAPLLSFQKAS